MDLLIVFAHPDDETVFLGGTLGLMAARGASAHYLCATRGEGGEVGEPPVCRPEDLGRIRSEELRAAVTALDGRSLAFLDYADPPVDTDGRGQAFAAPTAELARRIALAAQQTKAQAIISHGSSGEYGHTVHILVNAGCRQAVQLLGQRSLPLYTFSADFAGIRAATARPTATTRPTSCSTSPRTSSRSWPPPAATARSWRSSSGAPRGWPAGRSPWRRS